MADETKTLTPQSIPTTSFADKVGEYESISKEINEGEAAVAKAEFKMKVFLNEEGFGNLAEGGNFTDLWAKLEIMKPAEVDEEKTKSLRVKYAEHLKDVVNTKIELQSKRNSLTDVKNYITFLKEIVGLAPKQGGKDQQKGGQQQGGRQE